MAISSIRACEFNFGELEFVTISINYFDRIPHMGTPVGVDLTTWSASEGTPHRQRLKKSVFLSIAGNLDKTFDSPYIIRIMSKTVDRGVKAS